MIARYCSNWSGESEIEVSPALDFIGQSIGEGRRHTEEIVQRVGVLGFGQVPDEERSGSLSLRYFSLGNHSAISRPRDPARHN